MKYALDVSVALCWVISRPLTPKALLLRDEYRRQLHELIAPAHFPVEIASALTKAERQKLIPAGDAAYSFRTSSRHRPRCTPLTRSSTVRWRSP